MKWSLLRRDAIDGTPVETEYWEPFTIREIEDYFCLDRFQVRSAIAKTLISLRQMLDKALAAYPYHGQILPEDSSVRTRSNLPWAKE
jgi:hypothetical protein